MKKVYSLVLVMFCSIVSVFGQTTYTSSPDETVSWEIASSWTKEGTNPNTIPDLNSWGTTANVYGYVTKAGNTSSSNSTVLNVYNILVIEGDFTISGSTVNVHEGGLLVVLGNLRSENLAKVTNRGTIAVSGTFYSTGSANLDSNLTGGKFYLFGSADIDNQAVVDGCDANGYDATPRTCDISGSFRSEQTLEQEDKNLYDFIKGTRPTPQPVNLLYFSATPQTQSVEINWASSKAWDFSHYELERSADGKAFDYVTTIDAAEFSNETIEYSYSDRQPLFGHSYYRLKVVDIDGSFEYKKMAAVKYGAESFKVYPNPSSHGFITVSWSHATEGTIAGLKDNSGRTIRRIQLNGNTDTISTEGLAPGVYFLTVQGLAGQKQAQVLIR